MSLLFKEVPANQVSPGVFIEIDNNVGEPGVSQIQYKVLALGQKLSTGSMDTEEVVQITSLSDAIAKAGAGSQIANMAEAYFSVPTAIPLYAIAADDAAASAAAEGTITITGTATENGTYSLYIGGRSVKVGVLEGDAFGDVATKIAAAITADANLPVTAVAALGVVTITAKNKGTLGNSITITENYFKDDESTPAGLTTVIVGMANGETNPSVQDLVDAIPESDWYQYLVGGYSAAADIAIIETYLKNKYVATVMKSGMYFTAVNSTDGISTLTAYGDNRNSTHSCVMGLYNNVSQPLEWAAAMVTAVAPLIAQRQTYNIADVTIPFVRSSKDSEVFNNTEHNQLLANGVSTYNKTSDGLVQIDKLVTTYQENAAGAPDSSYRAIQSFFTVQYLRFDTVNLIKTKFQNFNITDDGKRQIKAANVTTPNGITTTLQNRCIVYGDAVLIENVEKTQKSIIVLRDTINRNRVNFRVEYDLANQAEVFAGQIGFKE